MMQSNGSGGVASVHIHTGSSKLLTEILPPRETLFTLPTRIVYPPYSDPVSRLMEGNPCTDCIDSPHYLVSRNDREFWRSSTAFYLIKLGMTDPAH
jgi:hypothetical protein